MNKNYQKLHSTLLIFKHTDWVTPSAAQPVNINMVTGAGFISLFRKAGVSLVALGARPIPMCTCITSYSYSSRRTKQQYVKTTVEHKLLRWNIWGIGPANSCCTEKICQQDAESQSPAGGLKSRTGCGWESSTAVMPIREKNVRIGASFVWKSNYKSSFRDGVSSSLFGKSQLNSSDNLLFAGSCWGFSNLTLQTAWYSCLMWGVTILSWRMIGKFSSKEWISFCNFKD